MKVETYKRTSYFFAVKLCHARTHENIEGNPFIDFCTKDDTINGSIHIYGKETLIVETVIQFELYLYIYVYVRARVCTFIICI